MVQQLGELKCDNLVMLQCHPRCLVLFRSNADNWMLSVMLLYVMKTVFFC